MLFSKVFLVVIIATFISTAVNAGSITIRQISAGKIIQFNVTFEYDGVLTSRSAGLEDNGNKTIKFSDLAVNVELNVYQPNSGLEVFKKFYNSSVKSCFVIYNLVDPVEWFEEPCQKLPTSGSYSITVNQTADYQVFFDLTYTYNGSDLTKRSDIFKNGDKVTMQIPDEVTNINFTLYSDPTALYKTNSIVIRKFYSLPVEKYFEIYGDEGEPLWLERPCKKLPAVDGNFVSVHQMGTSTILLKVTYEYDNTNLTDYVAGISNGQNATIQIPDLATNINVTIYREWFGFIKWISYNIQTIYSQFYKSPVRKCFQVSSYQEKRDDYCSLTSCIQLPAENGSSISVNQTGNYEAMFEVKYEYNGLNLTEMSEIFSKGQRKTLQIPDKATNINATFYRYPSNRSSIRLPIGSDFNPSPIKKCFELNDPSPYLSEKSCEPPKSTNSAQSSSIGSLTLIAIISLLYGNM